MEFIHFVFSTFWHWLGFILILYLPLETTRQIVVRLIRRSMVKRHGWPPAHLDADGDFRKEPKE